jgi:hypothetical protein
MVCRSLKERSLASNVRLLVKDIDDLREAWKPWTHALTGRRSTFPRHWTPSFNNGAIREFYSILRAAMMGARKAGLLSRLINDQMLPGVLAKMPPTDLRQWAKERPVWMREAIEEAFWNFMDQKWRDALNVAAAEPPAWGTGGGGRAALQDGAKKEATKPAKAGAAAMHVTGVDGKRPRQGDSGWTCVFKEVMGCPAMHPPWLCKVFGKLPAREREKLIKDNLLCPFCLLHDKDKPCGAEQRLVACTASSCKGRHIQKLHDFLTDLFREENQVHMVHGDDGWEESEEAWELGEEEMMIVGTVQQEEDCSWQDTCKSWTEQDEKLAVGVHQVGTCQGAAGTAAGTGKEAARQSSVSQCKKAEIAEANEKAPESDDLLLEGEEQEYFLKLLMRKASPERPKAGQPAEGIENSRNEAASTKGQEKRRNKKKERKALKKSKAAKGASEREGEKGTAGLTNNLEKQSALDLLNNPEAKGRGLVADNREKKEQVPGSQTTSRGECSGQKMLES